MASGFGGGLALAGRQAAEYAAKEPHILCPRRLQRGIDRERHFGLSVLVAHARHRDRQLLVREIDRARLPAPAHVARPPVGARVTRARELGHLGLQRLLDGSQTQGINA